LIGYLEDGKIHLGGEADAADFFIAPTVLTDIEKDAKVMEEEIFGPILPVLTFEELPDAIDIINAKNKPLALYLFTNKKEAEEAVLEQCSFGGGAINDALAQLGNHHLPFGGVGSSGMGAYHGKQSFETFSHTKSIMKKPFFLDIPFRYAPYKGKLKWIKRILK
jgi:aldehyde dehydrogenase (NAD+)